MTSSSKQLGFVFLAICFFIKTLQAEGNAAIEVNWQPTIKNGEVTVTIKNSLPKAIEILPTMLFREAIADDKLKSPDVLRPYFRQFPFLYVDVTFFGEEERLRSAGHLSGQGLLPEPIEVKSGQSREIQISVSKSLYKLFSSSRRIKCELIDGDRLISSKFFEVPSAKEDSNN